MPLISVNLPLSFLTDVLHYLQRLTAAIERIAGPELPSVQPGRKSDIGDLYIADPEHQGRVRLLEDAVAKDMGVVPRSPAYYAKIPEYQAEVLKTLGTAAVAQLPWNIVKRSDNIR